MPTQTINLNDALPVAPALTQNVHWQADPPSLDPTVVRNVSANVPIPVIPLTITFQLGSGATGVNVAGIARAPRAGSVVECVVTVNTPDPLAALTFKIKQNGVDIFTVDPSIPAATVSGTETTFALTTSPLAITKGDKFTMDITGGTTAWSFTAQLE